MKTFQNDVNRQRYSLAEVKDLARGRWYEILRALGIEEGFLNPRKHTPCPVCGGKDRFRFTDYRQSGGFICNHCMPNGGSGFDLLMLVYGYTFQDAVKAVAGILGLDRGNAVSKVARVAPVVMPTHEHDEQRRQRLNELWQGCVAWNETHLIADYLHGRGLPLPECLPITDDLRLHQRVAYWHGGRILGHFPAMVGLFRDVVGKPCGVHLTYLQAQRDGCVNKAVLFDPQSRDKLPAKKMRSVATGSLTGSAIRLFRPENGVLGVCEGLETAMAARYMSGVPMWACGSAHGIQSLVLPDDVNELVIVADNDANGTGIQAARALQRRYQCKLSSIKIWQPDVIGMDALDVLAAQVQKGGV